MLGLPYSKQLRLRRFKSDRDEIWHNCSSSKYASIDAVGFLNVTSYVQDGGNDVILHRNVLPLGQCIRSIRPAPAAAYGNISTSGLGGNVAISGP